MFRKAQLLAAAALAAAVAVLPAVAQSSSQPSEDKRVEQAASPQDQAQRTDSRTGDSAPAPKMTREEKKADAAKVRRPLTREEEAYNRQAYGGA